MTDAERRETLERLMLAHGTQIKRFCTLQLRDAALAEDAAQEVFVKAWKGLASFRAEMRREDVVDAHRRQHLPGLSAYGMVPVHGPQPHAGGTCRQERTGHIPRRNGVAGHRQIAQGAAHGGAAALLRGPDASGKSHTRWASARRRPSGACARQTRCCATCWKGGILMFTLEIDKTRRMLDDELSDVCWTARDARAVADRIHTQGRSIMKRKASMALLLGLAVLALAVGALAARAWSLAGG